MTNLDLQESNATKLTDWSKEPTLLQLKTDYEMAKPAHREQTDKIQNWNDQLAAKGKARAPDVKNRSRVQPKLIRRQAEWRYSALTEPFLSSEKLFEINPQTFEDHEAAQQNELVLNWQFNTKLNKVKFIDDYIRATVDEGSCVVRIGWKRHTKMVKETVPVYEHFEATEEMQVKMLTDAIELKETDPRGYEENVPPEVKACVDLYEETEQITYAVQSGEEQVDKEVVIQNRPTVEVKNPSNVCFDPSCQGDLDKALFAIESFETNKAELEKDGKYKNLDKVNWENATIVTEPDHTSKTPSDFNFRDISRKKVVAYEYWGFYDIDGTNEMKPIVATWIGNVLIRMEENPYPDGKIPFVLVPYLPVKRELYGEPDAELLEDNQKILGAITRGMLDSMGRSANGQQGYAKGFLDPVQKRRFENGQDYEFNPTLSPANGLVDHQYPELPQSAMAMLTMVNQDSEAMSGVKSFSGGLSGQAYGDVATAIRGVLDASAKREMSILRRVAKGMSQIGDKIVAMNAIFLSEEEVVRVTNEQFVKVKREDLQGNFDLVVDISTAEVDEARAQDLAFMLQTIGPNTDPGILMMILAEIARLKRMPKLANMLKNWKPTPDPMAEKMKELEVMKAQKEVEKLDSEIALNMAKAAEAAANKDKKDLEFVEQESGTAHARDMEKQAGQARGNQDLEITKALTKPLKEGETRGDVESAIGWKQVSDKL